jgi:hypothetical protein
MSTVDQCFFLNSWALYLGAKCLKKSFKLFISGAKHRKNIIFRRVAPKTIFEHFISAWSSENIFELYIGAKMSKKNFWVFHFNRKKAEKISELSIRTERNSLLEEKFQNPKKNRRSLKYARTYHPKCSSIDLLNYFLIE